jgi:predicted Zn-dependent protease
MIDLLLSGKKYQEAAGLAKKILKTKPELAILGIKYGIALLGSGDYDDCINFLDSFVVLPYEGANEGRNIYHEACIRSSLEGLKQKKYNTAMRYAANARQWPINLGAGRPYDVDEKLEDFIMAYSLEKTGKIKEAEEYYTKVADNAVPWGVIEKTSFYLQLKALRKLGREQEAVALLQRIEKEKSDNRYAEWALEREKQGDHEAIANLIMTDKQETQILNDHFCLVSELFSIIE